MPKIKVILNHVIDESDAYASGVDSHQVWFDIELVPSTSVLPNNFAIALETTDSKLGSKPWGQTSPVNSNRLVFSNVAYTANPGDQYRLTIVVTSEPNFWEICNPTGTIGAVPPAGSC
ncbi:MAG: hypothetical protein WCR52_09000 [Bacteroidota bacterium]